LPAAGMSWILPAAGKPQCLPRVINHERTS